MPEEPEAEGKGNGKWCGGVFPMPEEAEPEGKGNGKWCEERFRCRKGQKQREKATENGVYEHFRCRKGQNQREKATESGMGGVSDAERARTRGKKQWKMMRGAFPMPKEPEPVFMEKVV